MVVKVKSPIDYARWRLQIAHFAASILTEAPDLTSSGRTGYVESLALFFESQKERLMPETTTSLPKIGDTAPDFTAVTTQSAAMKFSEWQGDSWVVFFSHPADFTPVCSTELAEFGRRAQEFASLNTKLIGLSVDSIHSHLAWLQNMKEKLGVEIPYPLIADLDMKVSQLYGMIHPGASATAAVRAVFIIDPKHVIRALVYYPMNAGRNVDEFIRLVTALQTADQYGCACPVNWKPGEKVVVPPPKQFNEIQERLSHAGKDYDVRDFYLCLRDQPLTKKAGV
jgi:peroxiredoxin (alkyl hydroperoxide reductase subunit C)